MLAERRLPEGIQAPHLGKDSIIPGRRREDSRPFERAAIPRVAAFVEVLITAPDADNELEHSKDDSEQENACRRIFPSQCSAFSIDLGRQEALELSRP
jgi:hypothetical protein